MFRSTNENMHNFPSGVKDYLVLTTLVKQHKTQMSLTIFIGLYIRTEQYCNTADVHVKNGSAFMAVILEKINQNMKRQK